MAKQIIEEEYSVITPTDVFTPIHQITTLPKPTGSVIIRISTEKQQSDIAGQVLSVIESALSHHIPINNVHTFIGKGSDESLWERQLDLVVKDGSSLAIYESVDRAIRNPNFSGNKNYLLEPLEEQLDSFLSKCHQRDIVPVVVYSAELSLNEVRAEQTKRGLRIKNAKLNRYEQLVKKRMLLQPIVHTMHSHGKSMRQIGDTLGISKRTVQCYLEGGLAESRYDGGDGASPIRIMGIGRKIGRGRR